MSSKYYETRMRGAPYQVQKINLNGNIKTRRNPPKMCPDCKETNDCVKLFSNKVNKIEQVVNDFYKNCSKKRIDNFSIFNTKFTLNNVPCELEYDLSKFSLENLQKLVIFTTQNCNIDKNDKNVIMKEKND
ncbi:hypothetical protein C1645_817009 [Glomus cerebriforme]|uniref:Uncharacterized protein n=1 Tax=Glomus cerebriforme TaxID=658196 RepID=A0A397TA74_9GLOM|nr:hypothetical protein C1645_817009 [Glomus cerebriforme]